MEDFCRTCGATVYWVSCPTGGWWKHERHPQDDHDANAPVPDDDTVDYDVS